MSKNSKAKVVQMLSPGNYIRKKARTLPIYECVVNEDWEKSKLAQLSVARRHTNGNITVCFYLVDLMCLGVKDTHYQFNIPMGIYSGQIDNINAQMPVSRISYELAHNIVFAGLEFAEDYGFKPHKDFTSITRFMLEEDTDDIELIDIECGVDEKPTYMRGPFDDEAKVNRIIAQLEKTAGPGNYSIIDEDEAFDGYEEFDEDIFDDYSLDEKKEMFIDMSNRIGRLTDEEHRRFASLANSLTNALIDVDLHNKYFDEFYAELNIDVNEEEIPNEMMGISPEIQDVSQEQKHRFMEIYQLIYENPKQAASELKIFKKESNSQPGVALFELLLLQSDESRKYPERLKEYARKYPNYPLINLMWANEQVISGIDPQKVPGFPFKSSTFFPNRKSIHPTERFHFLSLHILVTAHENDLNKIEALGSVLGELNLSETDYEILDAIVSTTKVNCLLTLLK